MNSPAIADTPSAVLSVPKTGSSVWPHRYPPNKLDIIMLVPLDSGDKEAGEFLINCAYAVRSLVEKLPTFSGRTVELLDSISFWPGLAELSVAGYLPYRMTLTLTRPPGDPDPWISEITGEVKLPLIRDALRQAGQRARCPMLISEGFWVRDTSVRIDFCGVIDPD